MRLTQVGRGSTFELVNGGCLYLLYLLTRVLSLPLLLYVFFDDLFRHHSETWALAHPLTCLTCAPGTFAIWAVSCYWFRAIHAGMLKALRGQGLESSLEEDAGATATEAASGAKARAKAD